MYRSFEDLEVWQRSSRIAVRMYELTRDGFDHGLKSQMTRAAVSAASNIAEGAERGLQKNSPVFFIFREVLLLSCERRYTLPIRLD